MDAPGTRLAVGEARLRQLVLDVAARPERWLALVRYDADRRWYQRLARDEDREVWLLSWLPGQRTGFHDHGRSAGAFTVVQGCLRERTAPGAGPSLPVPRCCPDRSGRSAPGTSTTWGTSRRPRPAAFTPTH